MFNITQIITSLSILASLANVSVPMVMQKINPITNESKSTENSVESQVSAYDSSIDQSSSPETPKVAEVRYVTVTAYSSTEDQTDSTPFIAASGKRVYDGMVACNFLRFDTKVRFPELSEAKIYAVGDRMALKNSHKIDIWFPTREEAIQFGVRVLKVEILET